MLSSIGAKSSDWQWGQNVGAGTLTVRSIRSGLGRTHPGCPAGAPPVPTWWTARPDTGRCACTSIQNHGADRDAASFLIVLQVQYLPVYIGELLHKDPELLIPSAHLQSLRNDVLPDIERYGLPLRLGRQAVSVHVSRLSYSPVKEAIEHCRNILPKTGLALLQDVASAHFVTSLYMSYYTHTMKTKKSPHVNRNVGA